MVAIVVFLLLGIPVWKLTRPETVRAEMAAPKNSSQSVTLTVNLGYDVAPTEVTLKVLGNQSETPALVFKLGAYSASKSWTIFVPTAGVDILVSAAWQDANRHPLRVMFAGAEIAPTEKTFWLSAENGSDVMPLKLAR